jgi:hypothetical protein
MVNRAARKRSLVTGGEQIVLMFHVEHFRFLRELMISVKLMKKLAMAGSLQLRSGL